MIRRALYGVTAWGLFVMAMSIPLLTVTGAFSQVATPTPKSVSYKDIMARSLVMEHRYGGGRVVVVNVAIRQTDGTVVGDSFDPRPDLSPPDRAKLQACFEVAREATRLRLGLEERPSPTPVPTTTP